MPNHTTNLLSIVGEKHIRHLLHPYVTLQPTTRQQDGLNVRVDEEEESYLDFDKIVPMPKEIRQTSEMASGDLIQMMHRNSTKQLREKYERRLKRLENTCQRKYGVKGWYDWCVKYWGTKWNSYETRWGGINDQGDEVLFFQTAWSPAEPVYMKLAEKLNKIVRVTYMDEGYGFFGIFHFYPDGSVDDECYTKHEDVPEALCDELGIESYAEAVEMEKEAEKVCQNRR